MAPEQSSSGSAEPLRREARPPIPPVDAHRIGWLVALAALAGVALGFGLASIAYSSRLPALVHVVPFDVGARATPRALRGLGCAPGAHGALPRSWLGVELQSLNHQIGGALSVPDDVRAGAVVTQVFPGSPAERAGLARGDVVVRLDGDQVRNSADLVRAVRAHRPDETVTLDVVRDGARKSIEARLDRVPAHLR